MHGLTGGSWHGALEPLCAAACEVAGADADVQTILFYVARRCQKESGLVEPDFSTFDRAHLADVAARITHNLATDGDRVDRLVAGSAEGWTDLRRLLYASAFPRAGGAAAGDYADEALQKIAVVLLTGTPPARAAEQFAKAIEGPRNEYIFTSPFPFWARSVVINLIVDDKRRLAREREAPNLHLAAKPSHLDAATLRRAHESLPGLLDAIRKLPTVQRSVMVWSLARRDIDAIVTSHLRSLAPDLFAQIDGSGADSDGDIAERLHTTVRLVAANRSAARVKLARRDPYWKLLLDMLLPHRSAYCAKEDEPHG